MSWKVLQGDVLDKLAEIKDGTIQCCVTSPPYWGLVLVESNLPEMCGKTHRKEEGARQ